MKQPSAPAQVPYAQRTAAARSIARRARIDEAALAAAGHAPETAAEPEPAPTTPAQRRRSRQREAAAGMQSA